MVWSKTNIVRYGRISVERHAVVYSNFVMGYKYNRVKSFLLKSFFLVDEYVSKILWQRRYGNS